MGQASWTWTGVTAITIIAFVGVLVTAAATIGAGRTTATIALIFFVVTFACVGLAYLNEFRIAPLPGLIAPLPVQWGAVAGLLCGWGVLILALVGRPIGPALTLVLVGASTLYLALRNAVSARSTREESRGWPSRTALRLLLWGGLPSAVLGAIAGLAFQSEFESVVRTASQLQILAVAAMPAIASIPSGRRYVAIRVGLGLFFFVGAGALAALGSPDAVSPLSAALAAAVLAGGSWAPPPAPDVTEREPVSVADIGGTLVASWAILVAIGFLLIGGTLAR